MQSERKVSARGRLKERDITSANCEKKILATCTHTQMGYVINERRERKNTSGKTTID